MESWANPMGIGYIFRTALAARVRGYFLTAYLYLLFRYSFVCRVMPAVALS